MKVVGLLFVATTRANVSPSLVLELLQRVARVIKDYLGVLNEDSLRKNFVLVYELLDEVIVSISSKGSSLLDVLIFFMIYVWMLVCCCSFYLTKYFWLGMNQKDPDLTESNYFWIHEFKTAYSSFCPRISVMCKQHPLKF